MVRGSIPGHHLGLGRLCGREYDYFCNLFGRRFVSRSGRLRRLCIACLFLHSARHRLHFYTGHGRGGRWHNRHHYFVPVAPFWRRTSRWTGGKPSSATLGVPSQAPRPSTSIARKRYPASRSHAVLATLAHSLFKLGKAHTIIPRQLRLILEQIGSPLRVSGFTSASDDHMTTVSPKPQSFQIFV